MTSILDVLPECRERRCVIRSWIQSGSPSWTVRYQHGENPEAVISLDLIDPGPPARSVEDHAQRLREWCERIHRYQDGEESGTP